MDNKHTFKTLAQLLSAVSTLIVSILISTVSHAQINLTSVAATCLQNGELSWMSPTGAPANASIVYNIQGDNGYTNTISDTDIAGLNAGEYTVTAIVDGVNFVSETVTVADSFTALSISLSTDYSCGFVILVEESTGLLVSIDILSGVGNPMVNGDLTLISGLGEIGDAYQLQFTDECGNQQIIDYTIEMLFVPNVEVFTRCNLGGSCEEILVEAQLSNIADSHFPYNYTYIINQGMPDEVTISGGQNIMGNDIAVLPTNLICDASKILTLSVEAEAACGEVITNTKTMRREITMFDNPDECDGCVTINMPFAAAQEVSVEFTKFPTGMTGLDSPITAVSNECISQNFGRRNDYVNYRVCANAPFVDGLYTFVIDDGCCQREETIDFQAIVFGGTAVNIYSCGAEVTALQGKYSKFLEQVEIEPDPGVNICIDKGTIDNEFPGIFETGGLPLGNYTITVTDVCGEEIEENILVGEMLWPVTSEISYGCNSFDLRIIGEDEFGLGGGFTIRYLLDWEESPGQWVEINQFFGNIGPEGKPEELMTGITESGNFRVRRTSNQKYECAECEEVLFEFQEDLNNVGATFNALQGAQCMDGTYVISTSSIGLESDGADFIYELFDMNNVSLGIVSAESEEIISFEGLTEGEYTIVSNHACSSQNRSIDLSNLDIPTITGETAYCEGDHAILAINGFPYLEFIWSGPNNNSSNTNTLEIPNVTEQDAGQYTLIGSVPGSNCLSLSLTFNLTVDGPEQPQNVTCWDDFQFDDALCRYVNQGVEPEIPMLVNCWDDFQLDNNTCTYINQGVEPEMPQNLNCWDDFQFDESVCDYINQGVEPTIPMISNCWDDFQLDDSVCDYVNQGVEPTIPMITNCWDDFRLDDSVCDYVNLGTEPVMPQNVNCWDDFQLDDSVCDYVNQGTEPVMPLNINCWDDFRFDNSVCDYFNQGVEPIRPMMVNCWDDFQLDDASCTYINQGTEPDMPDNLTCWDDFQYDESACDYVNQGTEPEIPDMLNCWDDFQFDENTCTYINQGVEPVQPMNLNCWDDFQFDENMCVYINQGIEPEMPMNTNCWDDYKYDDASCSYINQGAEPIRPEAVNSWDDFRLDDATCTYVNVGVEPINVYIGNIFCPDCENNNRFFIQARESNITNIRSFEVYDRWGNKIFGVNNVAPNNTDFGWDGTSKGKPVSRGVYIYFAKVEFRSGQLGTYSGNVTLVK